MSATCGTLSIISPVARKLLGAPFRLMLQCAGKPLQSTSPNTILKIDKYSFSTTKITQIFPLSQSKSGLDPKFVKKITVRIQSKSNKIRNGPDPVQSKSSPMLISARDFKICAFRRIFKNVVIASEVNFFRISGIFPTCFCCFLPENTTNKNRLIIGTLLNHFFATFKVSRRAAFETETRKNGSRDESRDSISDYYCLPG